MVIDYNMTSGDCRVYKDRIIVHLKLILYTNFTLIKRKSRQKGCLLVKGLFAGLMSRMEKHL